MKTGRGISGLAVRRWPRLEHAGMHGREGGQLMTEALADGQSADYRELAKRVRSHPFVDGPTRKLVRSWIEREPAHQIPWAPMAKPLSACRVALVSSAGIA